MIKQAQNVFTDGLVTDYHPLTAKNTTLTDALNATLVTTDGNEMVLQNDRGNQKIVDENGENPVKLSEGFIPIGMIEHHGIFYIASYNPDTTKGELGTYPSPENRNKPNRTWKLENNYKPLQVLTSDYLSLTTSFFNFDLEHPVTLDILPSYDGSVNIIMNDGKNLPRLINSGFSVKENGTYEFPQRMSGNEEYYINVFLDSTDALKLFDLLTSLIRRTDKFPKVTYNGVINHGELAVGNYVFYFKYCDTDGNETDFIAESSIVSVFKGNDCDPFSIDGGIQDMNANKSISFTLSNLDSTYHYIKVYFTRTSSAMDSTRIPQAYEIVEPFPINKWKLQLVHIEGNIIDEIDDDLHSDDGNLSGPTQEVSTSKTYSCSCDILITGNESILQIPLSEINTQYFVSDSAKTQALVQGHLFLGNVKAADPYYAELSNISMGFVPSILRELAKNKIGHISPKDYSEDSGLTEIALILKYPFEYYNTKNIYYNVGYWNEEYYRLGIVYIYEDNSLSSVFNILGANFSYKGLGKEGSVLERISGQYDDILKISDSVLPNVFSSKPTVVNGETEGCYSVNYDIVTGEQKNFFINVTEPTYTEDKNFPEEDSRVLLNTKGIIHIYDDETADSSRVNLNNLSSGGGSSSNGGGGGSGSGGYTTIDTDLTDDDDLGAKEQGVGQEEGGYETGLDENNNGGGTSLTSEGGGPGPGAFDGHADYIYSIIIEVDKSVLDFLYNKLNIKGFFFVRQKRIPTIIGQGYTMPWDKEAKIPIIEFLGQTMLSNAERNDISVEFKNDNLHWNLLYVVEGFLRLVGAELTSEDDLGNDPLYYLENREDLIKYYREVIHNYRERLHPILRMCIDAKAVDYSNVSTDYSNPDMGYIKIGQNTRKGYWTDDLVSTLDYKKITAILDVRPLEFLFWSINGYNIQKYYVNRLLEKVNESNYKHYYLLYKHCDGNNFTAICPEFEVRQHYYNTLFTGAEYIIKDTRVLLGHLVRTDINVNSSIAEGISRIYYATRKYDSGIPDGSNGSLNLITTYNEEFHGYKRKSKIVSITDTVPTVAIDDTIFKSVLGSENEAYRFSYINEEHCAVRWFEDSSDDDDDRKYNKLDKDDFNLVRGIYSPYLGMVKTENIFGSLSSKTEKEIGYGRTFTIYYNTINNSVKQNMEIRSLDNSAYYTISDRINIKDALKVNNENIIANLYRGDCYLCTFTHRLNRNFNDPVAPTNDHILDPGTWEANYFPSTEPSSDSNGKKSGIERLNQINRGDINAVKLGSWITIKVRSSYNLSIRSLDESHILESGIMGRARGFYPLQLASPDGGYKIPNSYVINDGFGSTVGEKQYVSIQNAQYIKNDFANRITYSDVNILDSYKNNYRIFRDGHFMDYTKEFGEITKLIDLLGNLLCVLEHGVIILPVNERALAAEGSGGEVYINNSNVLPDVPRVLNDMYGSLWKESIVKTPYYVYGIDASRKKIWRTNGSLFEVISDFRVEKFLNDNLTINENDTVPVLGIKNIASHYNAGKSDVMFTFYFKPCTVKELLDDCFPYDVIGIDISNIEDDELAWNLCYNEILQKFETFYSWIPIASGNIDNQFYSFDRECSRDIALSIFNKTKEKDEPYTPNSSETESDEIEPLTVIAKNMYLDRLTPYLWKHGRINELLPYTCFWYGEQHPFEFEFVVNDLAGVLKIYNNLKMIANKAEPESFHFTITGDGYEFHEDKPNMYVRQESTKETLLNLGSNVTFNVNYKKLLDKGLFRLPKSTIFPLYYRRVDTYNDVYDSYTKMLDKYKSRDYSGLTGSEVSWDLRLNEFHVTSHQLSVPIDSYWLLVTEAEYNQARNAGYRVKIEDRLDIKFYYVWIKSSRMRGNSYYNEDSWLILISPLTLMLKNEIWQNKPPIVINGAEYALDITNNAISSDLLPNTYTIGDIDTSNWTYRKEAKIRDKFCKIRVRYSGEKLAIISAIITTFTISYN